MGAPGADGEDGQDGVRGVPGAKGEQGPPGAGFYPELWFGCGKILDLIAAGGGLGQDGTEETALSYTVTRFSNGDADVSCQASLGSSESAAGGGYLPQPTNGAAIAGCRAGVDMPPSDGTAGRWEFASSGGPSVAYNDAAGHPLRGMAFTYVAAECTVLLGSVDGAWSVGGLADVP